MPFVGSSLYRAVLHIINMMELNSNDKGHRSGTGWSRLMGRGAFSLWLGLMCLLAGCQTLNPEQQAAQLKLEQNQASHAWFRQQPNWKKQTFRDPDLLANATTKNTYVEVSLSDQRGILLVNNLIALDFPIASGKGSHPTPPGDYQVISKKRDHASNLYGRFVDRESGATVQGYADTRRHEVPEGARFVGSPMPYWIRLTNSGIGLHLGDLPGYPASHGCVRMPRGVAAEVFDRVSPGTKVVIAAQAPVVERYAALNDEA
jgi:lipoprotein-anchoring transpeptidase ErfK/SrfK